ncbi:MAG: T9SS type A sorting domain-containing protein [Ginsengibacter sp.]
MKKYLITGSFLLNVGLLHAQQGFVTVGGDINTGSGSVSFSVGQLDHGHFSNAGFLVIEGLQQPYEVSAPLPITLLYFSARASKEKTIELKWSTVSESNNDYFTIERSKDGKSFEEVTRVVSIGNSNMRQDYAATDESPYNGISFYRLKQTDKDGQFTYSQVERISLSKTALTASMGPNPTSDVINLYLKGQVEEGLHYQLMDMNGKRLAEGRITGNTTTLNLSNRAQATYFLHVIKNNEVVNSFKVIKK